jgi:prepilin signal peptidase PulO-like enzyme (type II secretory pathway)
MNVSLIIPLFVTIATAISINYLADVLPVTRSFSRPTCPVCGEQFTTRGYLLFQPCTNGHGRSIRTWIVLIVMLAIGLYLWFSPPEKLGYPLGMILVVYFGLVFVIDLEHRLILHPTSIFGIALGLIAGTIKRGIMPTLLGGLGGFLIMLLFYFLGFLFARYRAKRMLKAGQEADDEEALGAGDVILVTILGTVVGWPLIWFGLLTGILLGGAVSLCILAWMVVSGQYSKNALMMFIPYGPYFITSTVVIVFFPDLVSKIISG